MWNHCSLTARVRVPTRRLWWTHCIEAGRLIFLDSFKSYLLPLPK